VLRLEFGPRRAGWVDPVLGAGEVEGPLLCRGARCSAEDPEVVVVEIVGFEGVLDDGAARGRQDAEGDFFEVEVQAWRFVTLVCSNYVAFGSL
jgi:hypothetical protein